MICTHNDDKYSNILNWKHMVVSMVKPKWILPICRKCFYSGFHMTLECMDTKPLTRFWVHHNVSTQKGSPEPTNTPDQKHSRYHRQIHKLKSKITSGNNVMKSHRTPSVNKQKNCQKCMRASIHPHTYQANPMARTCTTPPLRSHQPRWRDHSLCVSNSTQRALHRWDET